MTEGMDQYHHGGKANAWSHTPSDSKTAVARLLGQLPGTHTASTATGEFLANTSYHGLVVGTARDGAPRVRLAIYKACWGEDGQCGSTAVVKVIDDAIHDGVDVLSMSLGGDGYPHASRHAVFKGIVVVFAGGNEGPASQTVANSPPWFITVAASTIDRSFPTVITLRNVLKIVV